MSVTLEQKLTQGPYQSYLYSYPHKTAYHPLEPAIDLAPLWKKEDKSALFLYIHIPFCTMRCGFCNLFTLAQPRGDMTERYTQQLITQMHMTHEVLGSNYQFGAFACGGGTPTFLEVGQLERIFSAAQQTLGLDLHKISGGIEGSPETLTTDRLQLLKEIGMERVSMGLQSFYHAEISALVRKQTWQDVDKAVQRIRKQDFPILNLDLIYGIPGQTVQSFLTTLKATLRYQPEELYLYPLYIRPITGLNLIAKNAERKKEIEVVVAQHQAQDMRLQMYQAGRDYLLAQGYEQVSMRLFKRKNLPKTRTPNVTYSCQNDGMVGLGCGARSYTQGLHYSEEYGVSRARISDILNAYCDRPTEAFKTARYGIALDIKEQRRRFIIQSMLVYPGLSYLDYQQRFGTLPMQDLPQLAELIQLNLAVENKQQLTLTAEGMSYADAIGPWLISDSITERMQAFDLH